MWFKFSLTKLIEYNVFLNIFWESSSDSPKPVMYCGRSKIFRPVFLERHGSEGQKPDPKNLIPYNLVFSKCGPHLRIAEF